MVKDKRYAQTVAAFVGAALLGLSAPAGLSGQCCQSSPAATAAPTTGTRQPSAPAAQPGCCSQAKTAAGSSENTNATADWRRYFELIAPGVGEVFSLAEQVIGKLPEFYEKLTFGQHATKWASWCAGKSTTGAATPCAPECCQKPAADSTSKPEPKTKCCG